MAMNPGERAFGAIVGPSGGRRHGPVHARAGAWIARLAAASAAGLALAASIPEIPRGWSAGRRADGLSRDAMNTTPRPSGNRTIASALAGSLTATSTCLAQSPYADAVIASQPSAYWRFEEASGPVTNAVAGSNAGTASGNVTRGVASANPSLGSCIRFSAGGVTIPASATTRPGPTYSVEMWVRVETPASPVHVITVGRDIAPGSFDVMFYQCNANGCSLHAQLRLSNQPPATATGVMAAIDTAALLEWRHVAVTFDQPAGVMRLYVDGAVAAEGPVPSTALAPNVSNFVIGMHDFPGFPYYFRGLVDEVAVYQRALTADEVRSHFCAAGGSAAACCPADLVADGSVDGADLGTLLSGWGSTQPTSADLNGDGAVDGADLATMLESWGRCPG